jgi:hypothetical protein
VGDIEDALGVQCACIRPVPPNANHDRLGVDEHPIQIEEDGLTLEVLQGIALPLQLASPVWTYSLTTLRGSGLPET